jgi:hypothetical protein
VAAVAPHTSQVAPATGSCGTDSQHPLCVHIAFTGARPVSGTNAQLARGGVALARTCAEVAGGSKNGAGFSIFVVPEGSLTPVGGHVVTVDAEVKPGHYEGPGTYGAADLDTSGRISVDEDEFGAGPNTNASVTVRPDGSGVLTFTDLVDPHGKTESGTYSWTCRL